MTLKELRDDFLEIGIDYKEMVEKFMDSEAMFLKYYKKFFDTADGVLAELRTAIESDDHAAIENRAHALKGLSGNIGINAVFNPAKKIVDDVRADKFTEYKADFDTLAAAYEKAAAIRDKLD